MGRPPPPGRSLHLGKVTEVCGAPEPFELLSLRAELSEAQQRIERATRQLELAAQLETRLEVVLQGPSVPGFPLVVPRGATPPSSKRRAFFSKPSCGLCRDPQCHG